MNHPWSKNLKSIDLEKPSSYTFGYQPSAKEDTSLIGAEYLTHFQTLEVRREKKRKGWEES